MRCRCLDGGGKVWPVVHSQIRKSPLSLGPIVVVTSIVLQWIWGWLMFLLFAVGQEIFLLYKQKETESRVRAVAWRLDFAFFDRIFEVYV